LDKYIFLNPFFSLILSKCGKHNPIQAPPYPKANTSTAENLGFSYFSFSNSFGHGKI